MNQNQQPPEDDNAAAQRARIERQLKQLQPRPATFDAESILSAAGERESQVSLPDNRNASQPETRTTRWLTIAASWTCGAVAGVLLTWLVLLPRSAARPTHTPEEVGVAGAESSKPQPNRGADISTAASDEAASSDSDPSAVKVTEESDDDQRHDNAAPSERRRPDAPRWSQDEWFVSTQLLDLRRAPATGDVPLRAGHYALRSIKSAASVENTVADKPERSTNSADYDQRLLERMTRPPLSVNPGPLLEELLGTRPRSRL